LDAGRGPIQNPGSRIQNRRARGLTLIELLVTIVILVTLIAGVLPLISPNNDSRKIRESSRQLVSLLQQAQAQAARDGRPVGVGFTDPDGDGMALEAYIIAEPPAFTGFASSSSCVFSPPNNNAPTFGQGVPPLLNVTFGRGVGGERVILDDPGDVIPPQMFRGGKLNADMSGRMDTPGDIIEVGNEQFEIVDLDCDDVDDQDSNPDVETINNVEYLTSQKSLTVRWISWRNRDARLAPRGGKAYRIRRRPMTNLAPSRTAAEAIQFPRGVGIDFDPTDGNFSLGVVFSPTGSIDALYLDGSRRPVEEPLYILLGRSENANPPTGNAPPNDIDYSRYAFNTSDADDELADRRTKVNLLNADSRWVVITPAGRILGAENYLFDPRAPQIVNGTDTGDTSDPWQQRDRQRKIAQHYARNLDSEGGG
jgi:prepilin-type N-terminal cleavage/methylation domain-containing protein